MPNRPARFPCCRFATRRGVFATPLALAALLLLLLVPQGLSAEVRETFESPEPSLRLADADCAAEILAQQRVFQESHGGLGCEFVSIRAGRGTRVYLEQPIEAAQVIDELAVRVWVRADRPGIQLLARVVFPRSLEHRTGQPVTALVWGGTYRDVGTWQILTIGDLPKLVQRQARILSSQRDEPIDTRQAYIDRVVLNAYGGPGRTQLMIDDLEVDGQAIATTTATARTTSSPQVIPASAAGSADLPVQLRGSVLVVDGRPFFARAVVFRGESLAWLKSLGFNTILLPDVPTEEQQQEAERLNLWLVASASAEADTPTNRVLAILPRTAAGSSTDGAKDVPPRPLAASARPRIVTLDMLSPDAPKRIDHELLLVEFPGNRGSREPGDRSAAGILGPQDSWGITGRPSWALVNSEQVVRAALSHAPHEDQRRQSRLTDALRRLVLLAVAQGARGWCLTSALPQSLPSEDIPLWTAAIQATQAEVDLASPWLAAGVGPDRLPAPAPGWSAWALETQRSRMVFVVRDGTGAADGPTTLSIVDGGSPTSADVYVVGPGSLRPLNRQRTAGGVRAELPAPPTAALLVFTQDPLVVNYLARRISRAAP